jgi:type I restriction enzyme, S subunit
MSDSEKVMIGTFLKRIHRPIKLEKDKEYKLVTIKMHHKGVALRCVKKGSEIKSQMHMVKKGDFILSGIDARNGAFGIIPAELDGAIVTNDFWIFDIDETSIKKNLFLELTQTSWFDEICRKGSGGITQRIRLQKDRFFNQQIHLPPKTNQEQLLNKISGVKATNQNILAELTHQQTLLKKLRQSIFQDAISGKLTQQWRKENPDVEPASELLKRIKEEKNRLVKEKKIPKPKLLRPITKDEIPFELPEGWAWCRLGEVGICQTGTTPPTTDKSNFGDYIPFIKPGDITINSIDYNNEGLSQKGIAVGRLIPNGSILMVCIGGSIGKTFYNSKDIACNQQINTIFPLLHIEPSFLHKFLLSPYFQDAVWNRTTGGTTPIINRARWEMIPLSLPPLKEQESIHNKIDKIFAYIDQLDSQIAKSQQDSELLIQAVLKNAFEK